MIPDVAEIQRVHGNHWIFSKSKKPEIVELVPNSHAVIPMDCLDNHTDVVALVAVNRGCNRIRGQFFASPKGQPTNSLKGIFTSCCAGKLFIVFFVNESFFGRNLNFLLLLSGHPSHLSMSELLSFNLIFS